MSVEPQIEITPPIATVQVDGPGPGRSLDPGAWQALASLFDALRKRNDVACVAVCGTGSGAFADGADLAGGAPDLEAARASALRAIQRCVHPTVAIVEGLCVGEGLQIAACCDLRVCGESSQFGAPIPSPSRESQEDPLTRLLGLGPAHRLLRRGELIGAERAHGIGLVNRVCSDIAVVEHGYGLAARIAAGAPLVNRWHKRFLHRLLDPTPVTEEELDQARVALAATDYDEGSMTVLDVDDRRFGVN